MPARHALSHRIVAVERYGDVRFFTRPSLNLQEGASREVPGISLEGQRTSVVAGSEIGIERDSLAEEGQRGFVLFWSVSMEVPQAPLIGVPAGNQIRTYS